MKDLDSVMTFFFMFGGFAIVLYLVINGGLLA